MTAPETYNAQERVNDLLEDLFGAAGQTHYHWGEEGRSLSAGELEGVLHCFLAWAGPEAWEQVAKVTGGGVPKTA